MPGKPYSEDEIDAMLAKRQSNRKAQSDPISEDEFLARGRRRGPGTYTATQTGARALAQRRQQFQGMRRIENAVPGQKSFEDVISGADNENTKKRGGY